MKHSKIKDSCFKRNRIGHCPTFVCLLVLNDSDKCMIGLDGFMIQDVTL